MTAWGYASVGNTATALRCWRAQAAYCESPNGGPVMAAGAGALRLLLGGGAFYHSAWKARPYLGCGAPPQAHDIARAITLVQKTALLWLVLIAAIDLFA